MNLAASADTLHLARRGGDRVPTDTVHIETLDDAYALQNALDERETSARIGFKLGATLAPAITTLALDKPFHASLFAEHHHASGATLTLPSDRPVTVETEFVVLIGEDIVASETPTRAAAVREATRTVMAGFELVGTRFDMMLPGNGHHLIADSGGNHATVLGEADDTEAWRTADLATHPATLSIDGEQRASGHAGQSLHGHPFEMVAWLLDQPVLAGRGLRGGELVYCGSCTGMLPIVAGNRLEADFGALGRVTVTLSGAD